MANNNDGGVLVAFMAGLALGAVAALLLAPGSGEETREFLSERAKEGRDRLAKAAKDGREAFDRERENLRAAFDRAREGGEPNVNSEPNA